MMHSFQPYAAASARFRNFSTPFSLSKKIPWWYQILDPGSERVTQWNHIFFVICIVGLFLDPLYFFLPTTASDQVACMQIDMGLGILVTFLRTVADFFYIIHILIKFRIAYIDPGSRVFGRGQLVKDPRAIAIRYLKGDFSIDLAASLPLPQIVIWFVIPAVKNRTAAHANHTLSLIVLIQYIPRFIQLFPLNRRITKSTGVVAKTAWSGAAYNLILFCLIAHIVGASWYVLSIRRQYECWTGECKKEVNKTHSPSCKISFLDCGSADNPERKLWLQITKVQTSCDAAGKDEFEFGMFAEAFTNEVASAYIIEKYFYCLWWGMRNLCSYGQDIKTSTFISETSFCILIAVLGLVLFSHLMSQMQTYLQSATIRLEEWRVKRRDTEEWMRHRQLPAELQERVRRFVQYKWIATRGVDEKNILQSLPADLRRQIQRHLCLALVRRVPFFAQMDDQLLDAICERLESSLNTRNTYIIREGDPVNEMLFIIRGQLESSTTDGGRTGFYNSTTLRAGDFCGEELLTWALMPTSSLNLPCSTRTVRSLTEVEAFALRAEDLKFVATQFKRLHSKRLQHAFRYYSHQWRTWGACFIQVAWRRFRKRKLAMELAIEEEYYYAHVLEQEELGNGNESRVGTSRDYDGIGGAERSSSEANRQQNIPLGPAILASKFAATTRRGIQKVASVIQHDETSSSMPKKLFKPDEPDFSAD
ncbi:probable cyclic nucleotide-gated ion channel 16 [Pyrus x bretschneideri]|uniref:probable cyclic nucleotide-gated ion channel 16 n=1 Tax=Pyrus x bretschneideri TaxID=225117 RepID=UPI002030E14B|nr:probable cyclic nucleotide-gated ion channel 16 [Pyrus x bretschneideri]